MKTHATMLTTKELHTDDRKWCGLSMYMSSTIFHRYTYYTCNALRLLFGRQKGHPANKKPSVGMLVVLT